MGNFNNELMHITGGKSDIGTPQFMGMQKGYSIEQVRALIKRQKRAKGFIFSVATGSNEFNLNLAGTARIFLGFSLVMDSADVTAQPEQFDFIINNEIVIDQTPPVFFSPDFMDDEYYYFPRPLSGTDELTVKIQNAQGAQTVRMLIYYI